MIRCLEEIVSNLRWSEYFMDITLKSWYIKEKKKDINLDFIKIKSAYI